MDRPTLSSGATPANFGDLVLVHCVGAGDKVGRLYTGGSGELSLAARDLSRRHDVSMPQRPQSNGVAAQAVRRVLGGTRSLVLQSGLPLPCWADVANGFCALRNVVDKVDSDKAPYFPRHGAHFGGQLVPFGASVDYKPASFQDKNAIHISAEDRPWYLRGLSLPLRWLLERRLLRVRRELVSGGDSMA